MRDEVAMMDTNPATPVMQRQCVHGTGEASITLLYGRGAFGPTEWRMCDECALSIKRAIDSRTVPAWRRPLFRFVEWLSWL
jgi:hypothetical protein